MATGIPLPGAPGESLMKGIDTGSNMFARIMQPILEREKNKQLGEQFGITNKRLSEQFSQTKALEKAKMTQLENHFQQQFGLSKAAASRAALAASDAHKLALMNMDPNREINQIKKLYELAMSQQNGNQQSNGQNNNAPQNTDMLRDKLQSMGMLGQENQMPQGQGVMPMQGQEEAPQYPVLETAPQKPAISQPDLMKMIVGGALKKKTGVNPFAEQSSVLRGPARDAADLAKLKKDEGENSEVYQNAKAQYDASLDAKKDLRDLRARTKAGLKPGEKEFFDPQSGLPLGKEIPLNATERASEEGNVLFNELYPYVYKGAAPFSGEGSIRRLQQAAANYKTDPKARKMFDDFLLSDKMLAATTVNESSTLKAGKTNRAYTELKGSLEAQDIPKMIKKIIKEYGVPPEAQLHAAMRYQKLLSDARKKAKNNTPATQKLFYNPEMQAQNETQINEGNPIDNESKSVIVIDPNGKKFETTKANAAHLPKGWKRG